MNCLNERGLNMSDCLNSCSGEKKKWGCMRIFVAPQTDPSSFGEMFSLFLFTYKAGTAENASPPLSICII